MTFRQIFKYIYCNVCVCVVVCVCCVSVCVCVVVCVRAHKYTNVWTSVCIRSHFIRFVKNRGTVGKMHTSQSRLKNKLPNKTSN